MATIESTDIGAGLGVSSAVYRLALDGDDCPASVTSATGVGWALIWSGLFPLQRSGPDSSRQPGRN